MTESSSDSPRDGRLLRGAKSRRTIARRAVDVASLEGLDGISLGRLAVDVGLSKSGVQVLFGTKEQLQLATVQAAGEAFEEAVSAPAMAELPGAPRVRALIDRWIDYVEAPLFPGGCFWAANLPIFDSRPGKVRDALAGQQRAWRDLLADELARGADADHIEVRDAGLAAFQIDAVLIAANTALRLGDNEAVGNVRSVVEVFLTPQTDRPRQ